MNKVKVKSTYLGRETEFDNQSQFLYITVNPSVKKGIMRSDELDRGSTCNIGIYNVSSESLSYLFEEDEDRTIIGFYFEKIYDETNQRISFNNQISRIINNENIEKRSIADRLFIIVAGKVKDELEFWKSTKSGDSIQLVKTFSTRDNWKLDIGNQKTLFIRKSPNKVHIESFDW